MPEEANMLGQDGRSKSKNNFSRCLLMEITNSQDHEESESQHSSQLSDQVNYGTQPEERMESFVDYDIGIKGKKKN